jgi:hypothetical protein
MLKFFVEPSQGIFKAQVNKTYYKSKNERSNQHQNSAALQLAEFRPRNLVTDFIN